MLAAAIAVVTVLYGLGWITALIWVVVALIREPKPSREELERASMRSLSWPTDGENDV